MKYQKLLSEFEGQLETLESGNGDILFKAEKGIALVEKCIRKLQKEIEGKTFETQSDEIYFFKHVIHYNNMPLVCFAEVTRFG